MQNEVGEVLYVGKARNLSGRLATTPKQTVYQPHHAYGQ